MKAEYIYCLLNKNKVWSKDLVYGKTFRLSSHTQRYSLMSYLRHYNHILSKVPILFQVIILIETVFYLTFNFIPKKTQKLVLLKKWKVQKT